MIAKLPGKFVDVISTSHGDIGRSWLAALPGLIDEVAEEWQLSVDDPYPDLSYHFVAPCTCKDGANAVLKIGFPEENREMFNEAGALRLIDGEGMVKLLQFDGERRAMLLEKLDPGDNLKQIFHGDEIRSVDIAVDIMKKIWRQPPQGNSFPKLEDWFINGFRKAENAGFAPEYVRKAGKFFEELNPAGRRAALHGDLHHENILSAAREPFLAIDPKGITGNFAYEITTFLLNHRNWLAAEPDLKEKLDAAIQRFSQVFEITTDTIRKWTFAQSVLSAWWTFEKTRKIGETDWQKRKSGTYNRLMGNAQFGMIGLGTMGRNFLLNIAEHGFSCIGYNKHADKLELLRQESDGMPVTGVDNVPDFIAGLEKPRKIMMLVPAGDAVDSVINDLLPHLEPGDLVIDGGNSHFIDTERREASLDEKGIHFLGVGVSGGEEGARHGASIMIGGKPEVYEQIRPFFEAASAKVDGEACAAHVGKGSAGHFVKMVHNGIEYGLMQILAETFDFMHRVLKFDYPMMSDIFAEWNGTKLNSFLVEITSEVLRKADAETGKALVEMVLDKAAQKGTGKWTSQAAMDLGVPIPTIDSAVSMRQISAQKETRALTAKKYGTLSPPVDDAADGEAVSSHPEQDERKAARARDEVETHASVHQREAVSGLEGGLADGEGGRTGRNAEIREEFTSDIEKAVSDLKDTLLCAFIVTYAQGMSLLQSASIEKGYELDLVEISKIWRGGCIIRSALLEEMRQAYSENPDLQNLILDDRFAGILNEGREEWRKVTAKFTESGVPAMCLSSALAYFDAFRSERLPANLIQAQRDFFGAHTYQRTDKEGVFHTPDWK